MTDAARKPPLLNIPRSSVSSIARAAEERYGIKADDNDLEKLETHLLKTYGIISPEILEKVFLSGEAASFLTVNETYFFREPAHFTLLKEFLPSFEKSGINICSAAVATGCEAYSIAMMIEAYNKLTETPVSYHIDAFDINPKVIEIAALGLYGERSLREDGSFYRYLADPYLKKVETARPLTSGQGYLVEPDLRRNIRFFVHNAMNKLAGNVYDIVFFRNAFIYFTPHSREQLLGNLSFALKEGGILFLGVSETAGVHHADLEEKNTNDVFYFQKAVK